MGIRGLSSFVHNHSDIYLSEYRLSDTALVVDGLSFVWFFSEHYTHHLSAFGGDYDEIYYEMKSFFKNLLKCNVKPIVIFDGGIEKRKLKTCFRRIKARMQILKEFRKSCWTGFFKPLMALNVMFHVLEDLEIVCIQCVYEADQELAALAMLLNCPVLSGDSDFFIFGVLYIPISFLDIRVKVEDSKYYMLCYLYDINNLLMRFEGLTNSGLSIAAALLGNDYVDHEVFQNFVNHVIMPNIKNCSNSEKRAYATLHWLKNETVQSAIDVITKYMRKHDCHNVISVINETIDYYKPKPSSILHLLKIKNILQVNEDQPEAKLPVICELPKILIENFYNCKISSLITNMTMLHNYFLPLQVEDVLDKCSHYISFPIIQAIYTILNSFTGNKEPLTIYILFCNHYRKKVLYEQSAAWFTGINIKNIMNETVLVRENLIFNIMSFNDSDKIILKSFSDGWQIFIMSLIYWVNFMGQELSDTHVYAVLIMAMANFIQTKVGYYKNYQVFMKHFGGEINRLSKKDIEVADLTTDSFGDALNNIERIELLNFSRKFIKIRQASAEVTERGYYISTIHAFAYLQSCLAHVQKLNALLNFPFPVMRISDFYSGTFLYNIYYMLNKHKLDPLKFLKDKLECTPNISRAFVFLTEKLARYITAKHKVERPRRPGKSKRK